MLRHRRGLPPLQRIQDLYAADRVLLADPPPLVDGLGALRPGYVVTGPCTWILDGILPEEMLPLSDLLLLCMGSTGRGDLDRAVTGRIAAWAGSSQTVYVGSRSDQVRAAGGADRCFDWLPLVPTLERTRVTVSQGGAGSSYLALSHGVPVVVMPTQTNHRILGDCIEAAGLGLCIDAPGDIDKFDRTEVGTLLDNTRRFLSRMDGIDGAAAAARQIEEFA